MNDDQRMTPNQTFWFIVLIFLTGLCLIAAASLMMNIHNAERIIRIKHSDRTPSHKSYETHAPKRKKNFMPPRQEHMVEPPKTEDMETP